MAGFDPRAPRPAEIFGWVEPSALDPTWVFKLRVEQESDLELAITRGKGRVVRQLAAGRYEPGEYELRWRPTENDRGRFSVTRSGIGSQYGRA